MIAISGEEDRTGVVVLADGEAELRFVEFAGARQRGRLEVHVAEHGTVHRRGWRSRQRAEHAVDVHAARDHRDAVAVARPFGGGAVAVNLDAVAVGVGEIDGFADAVVGHAFDRPLGFLEPGERRGEMRAIPHKDGGVEETGGARRSRRGGGVAEENNERCGVGRGGELGAVGAGASRAGVQTDDAGVEGGAAREVRRAQGDVFQLKSAHGAKG